MVGLCSCLLMEWLEFSVLASCLLLVASHLSLNDFVLKGGSGSCMVQELSVTSFLIVEMKANTLALLLTVCR